MPAKPLAAGSTARFLAESTFPPIALAKWTTALGGRWFLIGECLRWRRALGAVAANVDAVDV